MDTRWSARNEVALLILFGLLVAIAGGAVVYAAGPWSDSSSTVLFSLGALGVAAGQVLVLAGVIAVGVVRLRHDLREAANVLNDEDTPDRWPKPAIGGSCLPGGVGQAEAAEWAEVYAPLHPRVKTHADDRSRTTGTRPEVTGKMVPPPSSE